MFFLVVKGLFRHFKGYLKYFFFLSVGLVKELAGGAMMWEQTMRFGIEKQKRKSDKRKPGWQLKRFGNENTNL